MDITGVEAVDAQAVEQQVLDGAKIRMIRDAESNFAKKTARIEEELQKCVSFLERLDSLDRPLRDSERHQKRLKQERMEALEKSKEANQRLLAKEKRRIMSSSVADFGANGGGGLPGSSTGSKEEQEQEKLIRLGKLTPFEAAKAAKGLAPDAGPVRERVRDPTRAATKIIAPGSVDEDRQQYDAWARAREQRRRSAAESKHLKERPAAAGEPVKEEDGEAVPDKGPTRSKGKGAEARRASKRKAEDPVAEKMMTERKRARRRARRNMMNKHAVHDDGDDDLFHERIEKAAAEIPGWDEIPGGRLASRALIRASLRATSGEIGQRIAKGMEAVNKKTKVSKADKAKRKARKQQRLAREKERARKREERLARTGKRKISVAKGKGKSVGTVEVGGVECPLCGNKVASEAIVNRHLDKGCADAPAASDAGTHRPRRAAAQKAGDSGLDLMVDSESDVEIKEEPADAMEEGGAVPDDDGDGGDEDESGLSEDDGDEDFVAGASSSDNESQEMAELAAENAAGEVKDDVSSDDEVESDDSSSEASDEAMDVDMAFESQEETGDVVFDGGFKIPGFIYDRLLEYQKTGVKWLWELHQQSVGGIVGDEMGLGKTVQIVSFFASLHRSGNLRSSIVVCPATVLKQWVREFHTWFPCLRVAVLHDTSSFKGDKRRLIRKIFQEGHVLVSTYEQMRKHEEELLRYEWHYVVLDEGHKIRNPDSFITLTCKQFKTPHRLILSGAPIQNNLNELWSLFDFVFPGKLGTLPVFQNQFGFPITQGGYANASSLQVQTGYKCAVILRDMINPYMLRRMKSDVKISLPEKTEQVLFCDLSKDQRDLYATYLRQLDIESMMTGRLKPFSAIIALRKMCNHPDVFHFPQDEKGIKERPDDYGSVERSGKLQVLQKILGMWREQGHRVLVFSQTLQTLDIIEAMVRRMGLSHRRMDGKSQIKQRMAIIDEFNRDRNIFVFLLTTKVGGLGTNLTGANRIILFDPDWNPMTDVQARERAWRIGQQRQVTVYRLITRGTIEEKIYHRQIFKHFLTNKILKDPRQRRFFKSTDLRDLFTLGAETVPGSETGDIFATISHEKMPAMPSLGEVMGDGEDRDGPGKAAGEAEEGEVKEKEEAENGDKDGKASDHEEVVVDDDEYVLRSLFQTGGGVQSALSHDQLETVNAESMLVAEEAEKLARKAANALRQSRALARDGADIATPTWTGRSGGTQARDIALQGREPTKKFGTVKRATGAGPSAGPSVRNFGGQRAGPSGPAARTASAVLPESQQGDGETFFSSAKAGFKQTGPGPGVGRGEGAMSSSELLQRIRERRLISGSGTAKMESEGGFFAEATARARPSRGGLGTAEPTLPGARRPRSRGAHDSEDDVEAEDIVWLNHGRSQRLITNLRNFLSSTGGSAATDAIVMYFQDQVPAGDMHLFRQMLKEVAIFNKALKVWELRPEFV